MATWHLDFAFFVKVCPVFCENVPWKDYRAAFCERPKRARLFFSCDSYLVLLREMNHSFSSFLTYHFTIWNHRVNAEPLFFTVLRSVGLVTSLLTPVLLTPDILTQKFGHLYIDTCIFDTYNFWHIFWHVCSKMLMPVFFWHLCFDTLYFDPCIFDTFLRPRCCLTLCFWHFYFVTFVQIRPL